MTLAISMLHYRALASKSAAQAKFQVPPHTLLACAVNSLRRQLKILNLLAITVFFIGLLVHMYEILLFIYALYSEIWQTKKILCTFCAFRRCAA